MGENKMGPGARVLVGSFATWLMLSLAACEPPGPGSSGPPAPPLRGRSDGQPPVGHPDAGVTPDLRPDVAVAADVIAPGTPDAAPLPPVTPDGGPTPPTVMKPEVPLPLPPDVDLLTALALYLPLDDAKLSSTARDDSAQHNNAALKGFAERETAWVPGRNGGALKLAGGDAGGWIEVESSPSLNAISSAFTVAVWLYRTPQEQSDGAILDRHAGGTKGSLYSFSIRSGALHVGINTGNGYFGDATSDRVVPATGWVHVAATYSQGTIRLYMGGEPVGAATYGLGIAPDRVPVTVGALQDAAGNTSARLTARLDDLLLYSRTLSPMEIGALASGFTPITKGHGVSPSP